MFNLILLLIIAGFAYFMYKKHNGKSWKYIVGSALIFLGILFIEPSPDPLTFGLYALINEISLSSINVSTISGVLWDFELWSIGIGIVMVIIGMYLLNIKFKELWKKLDIGKYKLALIIAVGAVLAVSILDILSMKSGVFGNFINYTSGNFGVDWWSLFFKFVLIIFAIPAICYYAFIHKDVSESLGIFGFSTILYFGGLADIFYFIFQKLNLPDSLPWLSGSPFINFVSNTMGYSTVTNVSLLTSVVISFIIAFGFAKIMKKYF
jgi:hypothetical protein